MCGLAEGWYIVGAPRRLAPALFEKLSRDKHSTVFLHQSGGEKKVLKYRHLVEIDVIALEPKDTKTRE